jgi:hypothetical protein
VSVTNIGFISVSGTDTEDWHRQYDVVAQVTCSSESDGPQTVLNGVRSSLQYGSTFAYGNDSDPYATLRSIRNARRTDKRKIWQVDLQYSTKGSQRDPADQPGDPLSWAWKVRGSFGSGQKWLTKDRTGRALVNSANEPFEDVPPIDNPLLILALEKNTATIDLDQWAEARGKVNDATLWGLSGRRVRLMQWAWDVAWTGNGQAYIVNKFEVSIDFDGYYYEPLDMGFREIDGIDLDGNATYSPMLLKGELPSKPLFLNGQGGRLAEGANPIYFDGVGDNPEPFELEDQYDFSTIFPATLPGPIT